MSEQDEEQKLNTENFIEEFVNDVEIRCNKMCEYQDTKKQEMENMSFDEIKGKYKDAFISDELYRYKEEHDDKKVTKEDRENIYKEAEKAFKEEETFTIIMAINDIREDINNENVNKWLDEYKAVQKGRMTEKDENKLKGLRAKKMELEIKLKNFWDNNVPPKQQEELLRDNYTNKYISFDCNIETRKVVQEEFNTINKDNKNIIVFDEELDKGSCTKSITLSLYKLQEKYNLPLFANMENIDQLALPDEFIKLTGEKYLKNQQAEEFKNIEGGVNKGDIVFLSNSKGEPGHAMMCYGFNENNEPLLLGFNETTKDINAFYKKSGNPREGFVFNMNSFIKDKISNKDNQQVKNNLDIKNYRER